MSHAERLRACLLYGIVDLGYIDPSDVPRVGRALLGGGVDIIQLRGKRQSVAELTTIAGELHAITRAADIPLVINDYAKIARVVGAEGVHVGQDDMSIAEAREVAGPGCFVGQSTHSLEQAARAAKEGADYIGFGPLFATPTKPDYPPVGLAEIRQVHRAVSVPIFCIGGIKLENLPEVIAAGARRAVIVSGLLQAPDIAEYARACRHLLDSQPSTLN